MRRSVVVVGMGLLLLVAAACGQKSDSPSFACGDAGQVCCNGTTCSAGNGCQAGTCQPGATACGLSGQACCATGKACSGALSCQAGTCAGTVGSTARGLICPAGGSLTVTGATLTVPPGAVGSCISVTLSLTADAAPAGYASYSPVYRIAPASAVLAHPAVLAIDAPAAPALSGAFLSQVAANGFLPTPSTLAGGVVTAQLPGFGDAFVAGLDYVQVCAAGGTLAIPGASLVIPVGALSDCTTVKLSSSAASPDGYTAYSPIIAVEASGATLAAPATLTVDFSGDAALATGFWSRQGTTGYERVNATSSPGALALQIPRLGEGFVADGANFVDPPDRSCAVGKLVEGRTMAPSTVALFFTVDDCWGRPLTGLTESDFTVLENGSAISPAEASATILQRGGLQIFASLVIDMSASTSPLLPDVIAGAKAFVRSLQVDKALPVQIDIQLFAGEATLTQWQAPTLDTTRLLARLDALTTFTPADRSSTNLNGAVVSALDRNSVAQNAFAVRNYGGAFTTGYLVLFTDGRDTAGRVTEGDVTKAEKDSSDQVIAVGLQSQEYDPDALATIAPNGVITATEAGQLGTAFTALANRMAGQIGRSYLLGYCSPKRAGASNTVSVEVAGSTNQATATDTFDATGFAPGCTTATFATICDGKQCGGLGCGACDDRLAACDLVSSVCVNDCLAQGVCDGSTITNPRGYLQACTDLPTDHACGATCVDTTADASNCGGCGNACGAGLRCVASQCVP